MKRRMLLVATMAAALAAQAPAPPGPDALKSYLGLQDSQIESLRQLRQQHAQATQSMLAELAAKQQALREQLDRGSTDAAALGKALLEIESLRKRLTDASQALRTQAVGVLTGDQRAKLEALEQARKLEPAIRQAEALGLLAPLAPDLWPGPAPLRGRGLGLEFGPGLAPLRGRSPEGAGPMRGPRQVPPLPQ